MHAVIVTVDIAAGQFDASRKTLQQEVVPRASKAPGFVRGLWTIRDDKREGLSLAVFKTQQDAENAAGMARTTSTPPGVTIASVEIREVVAEAEAATV